MIEERNEVDGLMSSDGAVVDRFNRIWVEINRLSKLRVGVKNILPEVFRKEIGAFLGKDTQQLLEWLKRLVFGELSQVLSLRDEVAEVVLKICQQRSKVVRIIPAPTGQVFEVVLINELQAIDVVGQNIPELFGLSVGIDLEVVVIVTELSRTVHVGVHLLQPEQCFFLMSYLLEEHLL